MTKSRGSLTAKEWSPGFSFGCLRYAKLCSKGHGSCWHSVGLWLWEKMNSKDLDGNLGDFQGLCWLGSRILVTLISDMYLYICSWKSMLILCDEQKATIAESLEWLKSDCSIAVGWSGVGWDMIRIWSLTVQSCWSLATTEGQTLCSSQNLGPSLLREHPSVTLVGSENWGVSQLLESMPHSLGKSPSWAKCLSSVEGRNPLCRFHLENKSIRSTGIEWGSSFHSLGRVVTTQLYF